MRFLPGPPSINLAAASFDAAGAKGMENRIMKAVMIALIAACALSEAAWAEDTVPSTLVVGYENEGKVDASPQACLADVKEMTEWDKAATERGAKEVCAARKHHIDAYADLQKNYKVFVDGFSGDRRLNLPEAVANLKALIKACMDHKSGITTGGHNISIDIIANEIDAGCLALASNLLKDENAKLAKAMKQGGFVP
jgi:hypothetical protein